MTFNPDNLSCYTKIIEKIKVSKDKDAITFTFTDKTKLNIIDEVMEEENKWFEVEEDLKNYVGAKLLRVWTTNYLSNHTPEEYTEEEIKIVVYTSLGSFSIMAYCTYYTEMGFELFYEEYSGEVNEG